MKRKKIKTVSLFVISFFFVSTLFSQDIEEDFRKICFCSVGVAHPYSVLNLDNNWELFMAFKNGKSLDELDSLSINYTNSQIAMLRLWNLIEKRDEQYFTSVPIIYREETEKLRDKTRKYAKEIIPLIDQDYQSLRKILEKKDLNENIFSIFFAFVLDDLVWQELRKDSLVKQHNITKENPFWDGTMWLIQPRREFSCGTNSLGFENYYISINWSGKLNLELPDYDMLKKMLKDYKEDEKIDDPKVIESLHKYQFFNDNGELLLPLINADHSNKIYAQSEQISRKVADYLVDYIDFGMITEKYPSITKEQAMLIIYHEIMWDILDIMEENGQLNKPKAFRDLQNAKDEDLKDLVFIAIY